MENQIGLIVATHGTLAKSLVDTAALILGQKTRLQAFDFSEKETASVAARKLKTLIEKCDQGRGVIILSDLFGGTPGSLALSMLEEASVEVITGVNLPMAIAAASIAPELELSEASQALMLTGREGIKKAGLILQGNHPEAEA